MYLFKKTARLVAANLKEIAELGACLAGGAGTPLAAPAETEFAGWEVGQGGHGSAIGRPVAAVSNS
jgi:hypothetical protein